jgi:hypothetical protein
MGEYYKGNCKSNTEKTKYKIKERKIITYEAQKQKKDTKQGKKDFCTFKLGDLKKGSLGSMVISFLYI